MTVSTPLPGADRPTHDFKALYRKLERALDRIDGSENTSLMLAGIVESLVNDFQEELGFVRGRLYRREGDDFILCHGHGKAFTPPIGYRVPPDYPPHRRTLNEGLLIMRAGDPGFDENIERIIGVTSTFAAIAVGEGNTHVIAFSVKGDIMEEYVLYSLSAVRHVVNMKLQQQKLAGIMEEARIIQESLLPAGPPYFSGYDIDGRSIPTEIVGGDLFDYLPLSDHLLGVAIADASGHGLPAALLARDVITGLRVSMDANLKAVRVVEKLNRVIHRAALSSKFISLFYGELEQNGTLIYCNAGHNPPLLQRSGAFLELRHGGLVLGPNPGAHYERGHVTLRSADKVIMYTDGLIELENTKGRQFGIPRLRRLLRTLETANARETVDAIFAEASAFAGRAPHLDDMTVVVIRRI